MASQVTLYEFAKDNFKDTSSDLEDSLTWVEKKICVELGLHQVCERSEPLDETQLNTNFFFNPS